MSRAGRTKKLLKLVQSRATAVTARDVMEHGGLTYSGAVMMLDSACKDRLVRREENAPLLMIAGEPSGKDWSYSLTEAGTRWLKRESTPVPGPRPSIRPPPRLRWGEMPPYRFVPWEEDEPESHPAAEEGKLHPRPRKVKDPEPKIESHQDHLEAFQARGLVTHREAARSLLRSIDALVGAIRNGAVPIVDYCVCHHSSPTWTKGRDHRETWYLRPEDVEDLGVQLRREKYGELAVSTEFEVGVQSRLYNYSLRASRLRLGLTVKQLAQRVGIGPHTLGQYETLRAHPQTARAQKIADALQEPVEVLFPPWLKEFRITKGPSIFDDRHISLEQILEAGGESLPIGEDPALEAVAEGSRPQIDEVLETLQPRELAVLRYRFGLDDGESHGESHTLEETANLMGVTRERIRQVEQKALRKLRHPSRSRKLRPFID